MGMGLKRDDETMVNIAVCGAGNWGKNLVRNFASQKGASLRYICDVSEKIRQKIGPQYPQAKTTDNVDAILADPELHAVVVAVDVPRHYPVAAAALKAGKHVFVEKPLTLTAKESESLVALAAEKNLTLMVGHLLKYILRSRT
jgi:predicted dehydrogenase